MPPKKGSQVFLRFDSPSRGRVLHPGVVEEIRYDDWTVSFETRYHAVKTGEHKLIYYNRAGDFFQQPVLVEAPTAPDRAASCTPPAVPTTQLLFY